ncbi:laccase [Ceratobasidium sp. 394]|nr:laccase [Ceratobasidium sp. 394]
MLSRIAFLTLLAAASEPSFAAIVPYNFDIRNVNAAPDGFQRSVVSVNGQLPGTLIKANKGDTLHINVTNSKNLYDVDDENTIVMLEDWYHTPAPALEKQMFSPSNTALLSPVPDSALINGKGRYVNGPKTPRSVINVTPGKRYRLRVINASAIGSYTFSIEGHNMTIIEADGIAHQPLTVASFQIYAGQRYSVIIEANKPVANYWIRSPITVGGAGTNPNLDPTDVFAVLHYAGAPDAEPTTEQGTASGVALLESDLHALENPGAPGGSAPADVSLNLAIGRTTKDGVLQFTFNNIKYEAPSLPTLLKILANNATNDADFSTSEHTIALPHNKVIELKITGGADHPIHLHGHAFDVVKSLGQTTPNYVNPPRRDVIRVGGAGVVIRFKVQF